MAATTYTNQQDYNKFNIKKSHSSCGGSCGGSCGECKESKDCGCCPAGLVGVYDDKGQFLSCMTPNDAELYKKNTATCQDGYVMLVNNATGEKLGCVSEDNFAALDTQINGASGPVVAPTGITVGGGVAPAGTGTTSTDLHPMFVAQFTPSNTTDQAVTWTTSNAAIAVVDSTGVVTAVAPGVVTITATSVANPLISGSKVITFVSPDVMPTSIDVVGGSSLDVDATLQLYALYTPSNTTDQNTTWLSSNAAVAEVDSNGMVTAFTEGNTTITAKSVVDPAVQGTAIITVIHPSV